MRKWMKQMLLFAAVLSLALGRRDAVLASDYVEECTQIPKVSIKECLGTDYKTVSIRIARPAMDGYEYEIYRAEEEDGPYRYLDTMEWSFWYSNGVTERTSGKQDKIKCYRTSKEYLIQDPTPKFNKTYFYKIRLIAGDCTGDFSDPRSAVPKLAAARMLKGYADLSGKVKISWEKVDGANGYQIYRKQGSHWVRKKLVKKGNTTSYVDKSVKSGQTYRYKVCAYRKYKGKNIFGDFANTYKVTVKDVKIKGNYKQGSVYGPALSGRELQEVRRAVGAFKSNYIRKGMSDLEKVRTAYEFLRNTCTYAYRGWQYNRANTAWGALIYGEAQCSGYARGFKALCDGMGIPCYYIHANKKSINPEHQWNQVKVKGKWYILDAQGGYFLVGGRAYERMTGMRWDKAGMPACSKTNYKG